MKYLLNYTFLLLLLLAACKVESKKEISVNKSGEITITPNNKKVTQQKDTVKTKSAIGKTYVKYLHEIEEFKNYKSHGWRTISAYDESNTKNEYSNYGIKILEFSNYDKDTGRFIDGYEKYIVMVNNGETVIDYLDVEKIKRPKNAFLYSDGVQLNGKVDLELFAFAKMRDDEVDDQIFFKEIDVEIYKVYRADKETGKIFEIPKKGITIVFVP